MPKLHLLNRALPTPAENLACEEALLDWCETGGYSGPGILRFWMSPEVFVVLGYACQAGREVNLERCRAEQVPVLRRCSGGGTVLQGPGCLNYALILPLSHSPELATISGANRFIMERNRAAIASLLREEVATLGISDLALRGRKFSGNAQRRKRNWLLFHGTFLLQLDLDRIQRLLPPPPRQPDYREHRTHLDFLTRICTSQPAVEQALQDAWDAQPALETLPDVAIRDLVAARYSREDWNLKW